MEAFAWGMLLGACIAGICGMLYMMDFKSALLVAVEEFKRDIIDTFPDYLKWRETRNNK
jgi:hypothetical protein